MALRYASVCTGVGTCKLASEPLGWECAFFSEIEPFPSAVLAHHWPGVPNLGDFTRIDGASYRGRVDVLVGGTPCQAFSIAGQRRSLSDERGNLTLAFVDLAHAIDPRFMVWENVPGVLWTGDNAFGCFLAGLVGADAPLVPGRGQRWTDAGLVAGPRRAAAWRILDAEYFGVAQRRRRVFLVSVRAGEWERAAEILFEPESLPGNPPSREEAREDVAGALGGGSGSRGWAPDTDRMTFVPEVARCLTSQRGGMPFIVQMAVRRLTARECERLQGLPDDHTLVPYRGKPAKDGPRYKAIGNGWARPVVAWVFARIDRSAKAREN